MQRINKALKNSRLGKPLHFFEEVGSTNDILKEQAESGAPEGCAVVADRQTHGRGRMGRQWLSLSGKGLYMSVLLRPGWPASDSTFVSMLSAVALAHALDSLGMNNILLKWPNDILVNGKKIAGILVEPGVSRNLMDYSVIGIGVNVHHNTDELCPVGEGTATSCRMEGVKINCDDVLIRVLNELDKIYYDVQNHGRAKVIKEWAERRALNGTYSKRSWILKTQKQESFKQKIAKNAKKNIRKS